MKRKILSLITAAGILLSLIAVPQTAGAADTTTLGAAIKLGDYVEMGTYDTDGDGTAEPILWRCVAFEAISGYDTDGNPITDSTDTVTEYQDGYLPLMLADSAICQKVFDAQGSITSGSHARNSDGYRTSYGSNYWGDSNIRCWLNSSKSAGNVEYTCGNSPDYSGEAGFLTNFTNTEKTAIKTVTQKSLLAETDTIEGIVTGGNAAHEYNYDISEVVQNYSTAYYENVTDTVFLLDVQQIYTVYKNDDSLGGSEYYKSALWDWLRSPYAYRSCSARVVDSHDGVNGYAAYATNGVRPAFYLNPTSIIFTSGDGTSDSPYEEPTDGATVIFGDIPDQTYTGKAIEPTVTVKDGDTTLTENTDYTVSYSNNVNVGEAKVTVTGIGNYTGTVTTTFNITPKPLAASSPIKLGDYVEMGTYDTDDDDTAEPILWRCVAFEAISGYDDDGNPITDSTDTVTEYQDGYLPLMLADSAICKKAFDAKGNVTSGSHARNSDGYRTSYGSSYWGDSNIRDWLNSSASAGNVEWTCGNSPDYSGEAGFLTNFTDTERAAIKTVTQKSLLAECDAIEGIKVGGNAVHEYKSNISEVVANYADAYYENVTDTVFLLDVRQLYNVYVNDNSLGGGEYYKAASWDLLRSPSADNSYDVRNIDSSGNVGSSNANYGIDGVRPAFYLDAASVIFTSGDGTSATPYTSPTNGVPVFLNNISDQTYTGSAIELPITIKDGKTPLSEDTDYTVTYKNNLNAGIATVTVMGIGNYTGTVTKTFNIMPKPLAASIKLGDYVEMGEYNGSAIKWRCVAFEKISGYDDNGNPIIDSTQTATEYKDGYLPLMLADSAICEKAFDAAGSVTAGSHARNIDNRSWWGSDYWGDSNIRDWLNSSASAGNVVWTCGNSPSYSGEAGFLTNFKETEKAAIKTVTQKSLLAETDTIEGIVIGGNAAHKYNYNISEVVQNYSTAYYENVTDTVFLLDVQQLYNVYKNDADYWNGSGYYKAASYDWLRSPSTAYTDDNVRWVNSAGEVHYCGAYETTKGVRPAFYLNLQSIMFQSGDGTTDNPYVKPIDCSYTVECEQIPDQTYTGSAIEPDVTVKDGETELIADTDYTVEYENKVNVGTATVTITGKGNYTGAITTTFNIVRADSQITVENQTVTYGDTLTLTAKVAKNDTVSTLSVFSAEKDKVDFYVGEKLLDSVDVDYGEDTKHLSGTAILTINTTDKDLSFGKNTIKAVYGGSVNLNGSENDSITVTVNQKPLEYSVAAADRVYNGTTAVDVTLTPTNAENGDNVSLTATGNISSANTGSYTAVDLSDISISGNDADYYSVDETKTDVPLTSAVTISEKTLAASIKLGDYVQMGEYNGSPILWRCVAFEKISGYDADGNPITDSTTTVTEYQDGYLPLMLADSAICQKAFDAQGNVTSGSHARNSDGYRTSYGSNYWGDSNIRCWLNSSASAGNVVYTCGNSPDYSGEAGFLTNFTDTERAAIETVTQKSLLAECDKDLNTVTDATGSHIWAASIDNIVQNYSTAYAENITDTVFLLDVQQIYNVYTNDNSLGGSGYYKSASLDWLRSPNASYSCSARRVYSYGYVYNRDAYDANGVRPAFYLNLSSVIFVSGKGASDSPYKLTFPDQTYTGSEIKPDVTITDGDTTLEKNKDYEVSYSKNVNVGEATVTITGIGNYTGTVTTTFTIVKAESQTTVENQTVTYGDTLTLTAKVAKSGSSSTLSAFSAAQDKVVFYIGETYLGSADVDYGTSNSDSGTAELTVNTTDKKLSAGENTIKAVYGGSVNLNGSENDSITVTLEKKPLEYSVTATDRVYNGTTAVDVTLAPTNKIDGDNITLTATGNISSENVGSYTAVDLSNISISGDDADYYSVDETKTDVPLTSAVTISEKSINDASITVENISNQTYTGSAITPSVTVKDGATPLTENTDYTVSYSNNTDVGKATITITGKGNYNETKTVEFEIVKAGSQTTAENQTVTYGDTLTLTANVAKSGSSSTLSTFSAAENTVAFYLNGSDEPIKTVTVDYGTSNSDSGTATLTINTTDKDLSVGENTIKAVYGGSVNLNGSEKDNITVTLEKKEVGLTWSGYDNLVFDGNEKSVTAAVVAADIEDGDNVTVTVTGGDATNAGIYTATATLTGTDAGYYTLANGTQSYTIEKATPTDYTVPTGLTATYGQSLSDIELPNDFAWSDATVSVGNAGTNTFTVTYTPADATNYKTVDGISVAVEVAKATPEYTVPTGLTAVIGKTLESVTLPDGWTWSNGTASVGAIGENEFEAVFTPSDTDNYNIVTETLIITVEYATTETELKRGDSVIREDETVEYNEDNTITIDKSNDGTTDVTITVPDNTETVTVDENGDVTVPENGTVKVGDNEKITLPDGGSVDKDGNTSGETVVIGDTTVTAPDGEIVTVDEDGNVTVPENCTVKVGDNEEITLPNGGSVDGDGNVTGNPIKVGDTTITAPDGETVTTDKDGNTEVTAGDTVEKDDVKITVDEGSGTVDKDGVITFPDGGTVTVVEQDGTTATVDVEAGGTINPSSLPTPTPTVKRSGSGGTSSRKVTFDAGEYGEITSGKTSVSVTYNSKVKEADIPTVTADEGYSFLGWSTDGKTVTDVTATAIKKATTFTALYSVTEATPAPSTTAEPSVTDKPALSGENPFTDVSDSDWFFDSVINACKDGLMVGVSDTEFAPYTNITRGMFVTVLYRMESEPETALDYTFTDVATDAYYADAVVWGSANGIIQGYSAAQYAPDDSITREQMATIIYRYAKFKGYDTSVSGGVSYADNAAISDYALDAVIWSGENGIMLGNEDNTFAPQNNATRAEATAVFVRVYEFMK